LLELLVVMVIIGLLAGYVGPKLFGQIGKSESKVARAQIEAFGKALDQYRIDTGRYPGTAQGLAALQSLLRSEPELAAGLASKGPPAAAKLARTLALAGETMERAAAENAKDAAYRTVLRQMLTLQELFSQLVAATTTLGHTEAETRALEVRAEQLAARNDAGSLAELQRDVALVREENAALRRELAV
jgi:general secretion pathway protein G